MCKECSALDSLRCLCGAHGPHRALTSVYYSLLSFQPNEGYKEGYICICTVPKTGLWQYVQQVLHMEGPRLPVCSSKAAAVSNVQAEH